MGIGVTWLKFSPHAWGWTVITVASDYRRAVFPTRVGVDLLTLHTPGYR